MDTKEKSGTEYPPDIQSKAEKVAQELLAKPKQERVLKLAEFRKMDPIWHACVMAHINKQTAAAEEDAATAQERRQQLALLVRAGELAPSMQPLDDTAPMPFGKYQREGKLMQDVPASYLHYLWSNGLNQERGADARGQVADYIRRNLTVLQAEHPDGIW